MMLEVVSNLSRCRCGDAPWITVERRGFRAVCVCGKRTELQTSFLGASAAWNSGELENTELAAVREALLDNGWNGRGSLAEAVKVLAGTVDKCLTAFMSQPVWTDETRIAVRAIKSLKES